MPSGHTRSFLSFEIYGVNRKTTGQSFSNYSINFKVRQLESDGPFDYYETLVVEGDEVALLHDAQGRLGVRV